MNSLGSTEPQALQPVVRTGEVIEFKDEGETPDGLPIGRLVARSSGLSVFPDGRWATLAEARYIANYFGVELIES